MPAADRYRLLASTVMPRPIAWVVTCSADGLINAAPYSFFNLFGSDRPTVALGILARPGQPKDTAANIRATGEFVVNLVPYGLAQAMNATCVDAPPEVDELALAGLDSTPSLAIRPPRITASPSPSNVAPAIFWRRAGPVARRRRGSARPLRPERSHGRARPPARRSCRARPRRADVWRLRLYPHPRPLRSRSPDLGGGSPAQPARGLSGRRRTARRDRPAGHDPRIAGCRGDEQDAASGAAFPTR